MRAAIVTTTRGAGDSLHSFIRLHRHIGFETLYLFFDDPADPAVEMARRSAGVRVILHNDALRERWRQTDSFVQHRNGPQPFQPDQFVLDRQLLNVAVALEMARADGIDWLLHIDQDELFFAPQFFAGKTISDHFEAVTAQGVELVTYLNHEAAVDRADATDPFRDIVHFKRNPQTLASGRLSAEQQTTITAIPKLPERYFVQYLHGKTAVRVRDGVLPSDVHRFSLPEYRTPAAQVRKRLATNRLAQRLGRRSQTIAAFNRHLLAPQLKRSLTSNNPVILHYYNAEFGYYWRKYRQYSYYHSFRDSQIFGDVAHIQAEAQAKLSEADEATARAHYQARFVLNAADIARLRRADLLLTVDQPQQWLNAQ